MAAAAGGTALISRLALIPHTAAAAAAAGVPGWDILGICAWVPSLALILSQAEQYWGRMYWGCLVPLTGLAARHNTEGTVYWEVLFRLIFRFECD